MRCVLRRCVVLVMAGVVGFLAAGPRLFAGENYALLVAVGDYDLKELRPLKFTRADVLDFQKALVESGFPAKNIVLMHDDVPKLVAHYEKLGTDFKPKDYIPESAKIRRELELMLGKLRADDSVVVAFSGHGVQFKGEKKSYFCPSDAKLEQKESLIAFEEVFTALKESAAGRKMLLVDACQNDPQSQISKSRKTVDLDSVTRPQTEAVPEGIIALFSCKAGQKSFELPELGHGVFFYHLLEGWNGKADANGDGKLSYLELASYTEKKTADFAALKLKVLQTPQLRTDFSGEWMLRTLKASDVVQTNSLWVVESPYRTFIILERRGKTFRARFTNYRDFDREVTGTIADGRISWLAKDVKAVKGTPGGDNFGTIKGDVIDFAFRALDGTIGTFTLRLKAADAVQPNSVWTSESPLRTFTILERRGDTFRARLVKQPDVDREVAGTIADGKISWLGNNVQSFKGGSGGDNVGTIKGDSIDFTYRGGPTGDSGQFTLRLQEPR